MPDPDILERMRADWNERAGEDAHYYVAFGRRGQDEHEFFATAADVVRALEAEFKRLPRPARECAALEIGCGPGRLMRPLSRHFREIHGVDVSDGMIRLARQNLASAGNAHVHCTDGTRLPLFSAESFDFVYSYAVFQHIPSREVVFEYLAEARRVLRTGGILRCQLNGLREQARRYTTWDGVRIQAQDVAAFAREHDFQLLALEGTETQYMWTTWRKQPAGWCATLHSDETWGRVRLRNLTSAHTGEPAVPASGPAAAVSLWLEGLPRDCDLNGISVQADGCPCRLSFLGHPDQEGVSQLNAFLPERIRTGLVPTEVAWLGVPLLVGWVRVIPPGPLVPRVLSVTDGINLLSGPRVTSGAVKLVLEDTEHPEAFAATLDGTAVRDIDIFCTDPRMLRYEVNFSLPSDAGPGRHELRVSLGRRHFAPLSLEVA